MATDKYIITTQTQRLQTQESTVVGGIFMEIFLEKEEFNLDHQE